MRTLLGLCLLTAAGCGLGLVGPEGAAVDGPGAGPADAPRPPDAATPGPDAPIQPPDAPAGARACVGLSGGPGNHPVNFSVGQTMRTSRVHVPASYDRTRETMLVIVFHGSGSDGDGAEYESAMTPVSDERGFIVSYPDGLGGSWGAGDIEYTRQLIDHIADDYCVDPMHVFAAGFSNGGFQTYRLLCNLSDRIAAIAPVEGGSSESPSSCRPVRPVSVIQFHGTADTSVSLATGQAANAQARMLAGCSDQSSVVYSHGDATCTRWSSCSAGSEVELCIIDGGGHQWAGGGEIMGLGKISRDIDGSRTIVDFFARH